MADKIKKGKENNTYTNVSNAVIERGDMSLAALGLYLYLKKLPSDWVYYKSEIRKHFTNGRHAFESAWNELESLGYVVTATDNQSRSKGKFKGNDYEFVAMLPSDNLKMKEYFTDAENLQRSTSSPMSEISTTDAENLQRADAENLQLQITEIQQTTNIQTTKIEAVASDLYKRCVDVWFVFHPNWQFGASHGKNLKSLIEKLRNRLKAQEKPHSDDHVYESFEVMLGLLPDWYKDKDIPMINSKFNEVIEQILTKIKTQQNGNDTNNTSNTSKYRQRNTASRYRS